LVGQGLNRTSAHSQDAMLGLPPQPLAHSHAVFHPGQDGLLAQPSRRLPSWSQIVAPWTP
jgi:hypothetical protein